MNVYTDYARFKTCNFLLEFALNVVNIFLEPSKMHIIIQNSEYKVICPLNCHSSVGQRLMFEVKYSG